jgi:hypothetical protein
MTTRNRQSAKTIGARTETDVAAYLAAALDDDRIERRTRNGSKDRGDITGVQFHGKRLVIEIKDCKRQELPAWTLEAQLEAGNDDALAGIVIAKRKGTRDVGRYWVHMTVTDLVALISGERQPQ